MLHRRANVLIGAFVFEKHNCEERINITIAIIYKVTCRHVWCRGKASAL